MIQRASLLLQKLIWKLDNTGTKRSGFKSGGYDLGACGFILQGTTPRVMNPHRRPPHAAQSERVIRRRCPIKRVPDLSPWEQPTSCLPFELPTLAATSSICQSTRRCPRSVFPQPGIVASPAPQGDRRGLWPVALHQEVSTDKNTAKIKARDQPSVSVSLHSIYEIGLCALGVSA